MWTGEGEVQVKARMETTPAMGVPSISVSQKQTPKKFGPVVAPKPQFNPYKTGDPIDLAGGKRRDSDRGACVAVFVGHNQGSRKTLEERRSSLDAEIDSLTSILADLESNSPYKPRNAQNSETLPSVTSPNAPVTGYKRMVIPTQPPLTATKKSGAPGGTLPRSQAEHSPSSASPVARPQFHTVPQPVPATYATASTPSQPTFNVQVHKSWLVPISCFVPLSKELTQPSHTAAPTQQGFPQPVPKKTYITDPPASLVPPVHLAPQKAPSGARPEEELERLTKKMLYDMDNPPTEEYFGRCASCGDNVVGEGTGCTAMDQVFHVDCFICMTCSGRLRGKPFYAVEKKAYCEPCYINTLESCNICSNPIMERILRATGKAYHPHCFTCVVCQRSLDGIPFTVDAANHIHCIDDFHKKFAPRCSVCSEPIMPAPGQEETVRIVALDRDFHVQCYRCEDCGSLLSEGDNQGCYPLDTHVLCKSCNTSRIQALTAKATTDL
uniref:LIM domain containing preferred translocation partner in lipoma n=1 Tax=Oncorhynchus kisutch TaxID=8019 RepID=A0A8C7KFU7_ONCKI